MCFVFSAENQYFWLYRYFGFRSLSFGFSCATIQILACSLFDFYAMFNKYSTIDENLCKFCCSYHDRDPATAQDHSKNQEGYRDFLQTRSDVWAVAHFQCTVPAQQPALILQAVEMIKSGQYDSVFGASPSHKFRWSLLNSKMTSPTSTALNFNPANRPRRQDWNGEVVESG